METYCINITIKKRFNLMRKLILTSYVAMILIIVFSSANGQTKRINMELNDVEIETVLEELRSKTDVSIVYNHEQLVDLPKVSISADQNTVEEILERVLKDTGVTFEKINDTIVIKPADKSWQPGPESEVEYLQTIRGKVLDRDSKSPLPFATVQILQSAPTIGTTTDIDGDFVMENVPVGRYSLKFSFVGYADVIVQDVLLGSAKELVVNAELSEQVQALGELVISAKKDEPVNDMAIVNARQFDAEESKRYAATVGDPGRMAQIYPGVSGTDDASNEIAIRGNSPNWLLWRLEGVEIPSPNHFAEEGYSSGAISILSVNMLGSSDFYTGAFPAEYGNALSGVFDINLRNGNNRDHEFVFQAGVLGIEASVEGPFRKGYDGSFLFNYRYSTLALLNDFGIEISENALAKYQDLSFKINLPTRKIGTFSLWGIGGQSESDEDYYPDSANGEELEDGYSDLTTTGMHAVGLTHMLPISNDSYIRTVISRSSSNSSQDYAEMDSLGNMNDTFYDKLQNNAVRINSYYNRKFSSRLTMRTGIGLNFLDYAYYTRSFDEDTNDWNVYLDSEGKTQMYQGYAQLKYKFSNRLVFSGGMHYSHFALSQDNSVEPRISFSYELPNEQKFGLGYGKHTRHEQLPVYFVENEQIDGTVDMPNSSLKLTRSHHFMLSYERPIFSDASIKGEIYYQHIPNLPVPTNPDKYWSPIFGGLDPDDTLANIGAGKNYGIELTLHKHFSNHYYFFITSSLFESKYKTADGQWRDTRYNLQYINNFVGGKEFSWGQNKMIGLNAKMIWTGGKRMTPLDLAQSIEEGEAVYHTDRMFTLQARDYFRFDFGVKLHFFGKKTEQIIALDIQNITNRLNTWFEVYNSEKEEVIEYPMAGLIPILSYRVEF
jgi:hypothetical protein